MEKYWIYIDEFRKRGRLRMQLKSIGQEMNLKQLILWGLNYLLQSVEIFGLKKI